MSNIAPSDIVELIDNITPIAWARCRPFRNGEFIAFGLPLMAWRYDVRQSSTTLIDELDQVFTSVVHLDVGEVRWVYKIRREKPNRSLHPDLLDKYLQTGNYHSDSEAVEVIDSQQPDYVKAANRDLSLIKERLMKLSASEIKTSGHDL